MKPRNLLFLALMAGFQLPALAQQAPASSPAAPSAAAQPAFGPGSRPMLSPEEREKVRNMTPEQRQAYMKEMRDKRMAGMGVDRDNNPPGPAGGPGTNWENRPGPQGGPGASPDRKPFLTPEQRDQLKNMSPQDRRAAMQEIRETHLGKGGGKHPRHHPMLTPAERDKLQAMTPDQRRAYMQEMRDKVRKMNPDERRAYMQERMGAGGPGAGKGGNCQPPACGPRQP